MGEIREVERSSVSETDMKGDSLRKLAKSLSVFEKSYLESRIEGVIEIERYEDCRYVKAFFLRSWILMRRMSYVKVKSWSERSRVVFSLERRMAL